MIYKPEYDENGKKILCEMNGVNPDMLMDIYVKRLKKGEKLEICEDKNAIAFASEIGECAANVLNRISNITGVPIPAYGHI